MVMPYVKNDYLSGPRRQARLRITLSANGQLTLPKGYSI